MKSDAVLSYDGSFEGWLCCVFDFYDYRMKRATIQQTNRMQPGLFGSTHQIHTDRIKADRVWKGINSISSRCARILFKVHLSELEGIENTMLLFTQRLFNQKCDISKDFGDSSVLRLSQVLKKINRESHRMEAFVRFRLTKDQVYLATIEPDFNVIPLISSHFKNRYADQKWIIYDIKRAYGIYYDLEDVEIVGLDSQKINKIDESMFTEGEMEFQALWKDYFKATGIAERKNTKLHLQHVPKRYWKHLSEKFD